MGKARAITAAQRQALLGTLKARFAMHPKRHDGVEWAKVQQRLEAHPDKLWSLQEMERTGGEPDLVGRAGKSGQLVFVDCSPESPAGRRSLCYDGDARRARKEHPPEGSAQEMAATMGIDLLDEQQYRDLQAVGTFDAKTSSWLQTPAAIRKLGGAIFGDLRYGRIFIYHNGAQSYYAARGFRGVLRV
jgi:hypothetical protein